MLLKNLVEISQGFPELQVESKILEPLEKLYPEAKKGKYFMLSLSISFILALFLFFLFATMMEMGDSATYAALSGLFFLLFILLLPSFELKTKTKRMEAEMPFVLRTVGMFRNMKIPFVRCLAMAADEDSEISTELKKIINEVNRGVSLERALARFASLFSSYSIKRSLAQILSAYETGSSGDEMKRIGDELLAVQQHELRESASRNALFGMLFIMSTAILPSFFVIYVMVSNYGMGAAILDDLTIAVALLVVFPAISASLLLMSKSMVPYNPLLPKGSGVSPSLLAGAFLFIGSFLLNDPVLNIVGVVAAIAIMGWTIYKDYKKEKKIEEIEQYLPDALFSIAALPKSAKMEKIFDVMASGGYKALSEEALVAKRQLATNISSDKVLEDLWKRNQSPALKKVCIMVKHAYDTNSVEQLHSIAEDMLKNFEIRRDRAALMSMQKYTILFGGLIIPFILKTAISLIGSLAGLIVENAANATEKLVYINSLIPAYLVLYALISSVYVADIEGKKSRAAIYFIALSIASILIYNFVSF